MTQEIGLVGLPPELIIRPIERLIYEQLWEHAEYRAVAPGEQYAMEFLDVARPAKGASVLDLGCGTGRGGAMLATQAGLDVTLLDFAANCLDTAVRALVEGGQYRLRFEKADLAKKVDCAAQYGYSVDVLEHIPHSVLHRVIDNCLMAAHHCYFRIATGPDVCGNLVGHELHLSQHDFAWWHERFRERECVIHWSRDDGHSVAFYVSAWTNGQEIVDAGVVNVGEEQIKANVAVNAAAGWQQVVPHEQQDTEVMILGGAPSLNDFAEEIRANRAAGMKLVTLNGAYNWCLERGLTPSATVVVDARAFNARFTHPVVDECRYLLSSQCDPSVLEGLPHDRTLLWHTSAESIAEILSEHYEAWYGIPGGSTVLLRAIPLLLLLGYHRFHLYGCDSCLTGDLHHAYAQPENEGNIVIPTECGGRIFACHPWQIAQGSEFAVLCERLADDIELEIHGDGLLAHILETGAAMGEEEDAGQPEEDAERV